MPPAPLRPANVADRIHSAAIHLLRSLRRVDRESGLSAARLSALSVVVFAGPVTIGELADAEQVSSPTMTRLVLGMEQDGLIRRTQDDRDRRVVWLHPTTKGARILKGGRRRRVAALAREVARLSAAERALLARAAQLIERLAVSTGARSG